MADDQRPLLLHVSGREPGTDCSESGPQERRAVMTEITLDAPRAYTRAMRQTPLRLTIAMHASELELIERAADRSGSSPFEWCIWVGVFLRVLVMR